MKPRLRLRRGIWTCTDVVIRFAADMRRVGHGYTPLEAYVDWMDIVSKEAA